MQSNYVIEATYWQTKWIGAHFSAPGTSNLCTVSYCSKKDSSNNKLFQALKC